MKSSILFFSLYLLFRATPGCAQISIIPKAGLTFSTVAFADEVWEGRKTLTGFTAGLGFNYSLTGDNFLSVQPEVLYTQKGFGAQSSGIINYDGIYRLSYIELPVLLRLSFGTETIQAYVNAGPSFGYLIGGRVKGSGNLLGLAGGNLNEPINFTDTPNRLDITQLDANRLEIGANLGGGIGYHVGENASVFIDARYNLGVTDFDKMQESKNRVIYLTAGVQIPF